jgi:hypothetical protein
MRAFFKGVLIGATVCIIIFGIIGWLWVAAFFMGKLP